MPFYFKSEQPQDPNQPKMQTRVNSQQVNPQQVMSNGQMVNVPASIPMSNEFTIANDAPGTIHGDPTLIPATNGKTTMDKIAESPIVSGINSFGGGLASGLASIPGRAISGKQYQIPLPPHVKEAMQEYQTIASAGKLTAELGAGAALLSATAGVINPYTGTVAKGLLGEGVITDLAANTIVGTAMSGEDRKTGAMYGLAGGAIGSVLGKLTSKVINVGTIQTQVDDMVKNVNSTLVGNADEVVAKAMANKYTMHQTTLNQLDEVLKAANPAVTTVPRSTVQKAKEIQAIISDPKKLLTLTPDQKDILKTILKYEKNTEFNFTELRTLKRNMQAIISDAYKSVGKTGKSGQLASSGIDYLDDIVKAIDDDMGRVAKRLGPDFSDTYTKYNAYYKKNILPLQEFGYDNFSRIYNNMAKPEMADKLQALQIELAQSTDGIATKFLNPKKPEIAREFLKTLDPSTRVTVEQGVLSKLMKENSVTLSNGTINSLAFKQKLTELNKQIPMLLSKETKAKLPLLYKAIEEANTMLGMSFDTAKVTPFTKLATAMAMGGALSGGGALYAGASLPQAALAVGAGAAVIKMLNSPAGQKALIKLNTPAGKEVFSRLLNAGILDYTLRDLSVEDPSIGI
jgi:hypothetical protein